MRLSDMFPSKWLKAADLTDVQGKTHTPTVKIRSISKERVGAPPNDEDKFVIWFVGKDKGLILNKTKGEDIGRIYGDDTDNWVGKHIQMYTSRIKAFGSLHDVIRFRSPGTVSAAPDPVVEGEPDEDPDDFPESLADAPADTAADYVLLEPPKGKPPVFKTMKDALAWSVEMGAFDDTAAAKKEYMQLKATKSNAEWDVQPGLWLSQWIEFCTLMANAEPVAA